MSALLYWLWLSAAPVSEKAKTALLKRYRSPEAAYLSPEGSFKAVQGISAREAAQLENRNPDKAREILEKCREQNIGIITLQDAAYPERLKNTENPPVLLYVKGRLPNMDGSALITVAGTRKAGKKGIETAERFARQICACGGVVVTGINAGIDAAAARAALSCGGSCIAVIATAHEKATGELARELCEKGAVISEYPPGTKTQKGFYISRNRIAAGLSVASLIIEAPEKSGALLVAAEAAAAGRELFAAVPEEGETAAGNAWLINNGATAVSEAWEMLRGFSSAYKLAPAEPCEKPVAVAEAEEEEPEEEGISPEEREKLLSAARAAGLDARQMSLLTAIDTKAMHIDDIIERSGVESAKALSALTLLEVKGYIQRLPGRCFKIKAR